MYPIRVASFTAKWLAGLILPAGLRIPFSEHTGIWHSHSPLRLQGRPVMECSLQHGPSPLGDFEFLLSVSFISFMRQLGGRNPPFATEYFEDPAAWKSRRCGAPTRTRSRLMTSSSRPHASKKPPKRPPPWRCSRLLPLRFERRPVTRFAFGPCPVPDHRIPHFGNQSCLRFIVVESFEAFQPDPQRLCCPFRPDLLGLPCLLCPSARCALSLVFPRN